MADEIKVEETEGKTPEVSTQSNAEGTTESKELILGRFKSNDELANAYRELEKEFTQRNQRLSEYEQYLQQIQKGNEGQQNPYAETEFWNKPVDMTQRIVRDTVLNALDPVYSSMYEVQKERYRNDPEFQKYEQEVDNIVRNMPQLKSQHGIVDKLYKMVRGLHFNEDDYRKRVIEEYQTRQNDKSMASFESPNAPRIPSQTTVSDLTDEEKSVAIRFNPDLTPQEAIKRYQENKIKAMAGRK